MFVEESQAARRIDSTTWGLLLLMTGVLLFAPNAMPEGTWLVLAGVILLGASVARYAMHLKVSAFIVALALVAVAGGGFTLAGMKVPLFAAFLVLLGASIMFRSWLTHSEA